MATGGSRKRRAVTQSSRLGENGFNIEYVENARVTDRNGTLSIGPSIDPNKGCLKWFVKAFHRHINQYLSAICWEYFAYPVVTQCGHSFCNACISKYLELSEAPKCPECAKSLQANEIYPNFALQAAMQFAVDARDESNPSLISLSKDDLIDDCCMKFPKTKKIEKKTRTSEARRRYAQSKLVLEFLLKTQTEKDRQLRILSSELSMLNVDIARVNQRIKIVENDFFDSNQIAGTIKDDFSPELTGISLDPNVPVLQDDALFDSQPTPKRHTTGKILERSVVSNSSDKTLVPSAEILNNQSAITQCTPPVTFDFHKHMAGLQSCYFDSSFGQYDGEPLEMFERTLGRISNMTNLKTRSNVKLGDLTGSANIVSSIEFNRCGDLFATAGVSKRIRIYNFDEAINDSIPLHLPEREISTSSKISCISWSSFQKTHIASSDYNGLVVLYDALGCTDHPVMVLEEHDKRCWSVDYSTVDPRRLASGSDDGTVKIWSTTEKRSSITIDGRANVCSVRFHPKRQDLIAFGSADHNVHLYDLRKSSTALRILKGHQKAVSYVKFTSEGEIVSASTDCSLCLWSVPGISLNNDFTVPMGNEKNKDGIVRSYKGHLNEKNFVGLSVSGDAIACGSEDNAVYVYHRELESPLAVSKFISRCPVTNSIVESAVSAASASGEGYQFVSGLAWSPRDPGILLAANSQGHIRILELCSSATDD